MTFVDFINNDKVLSEELDKLVRNLFEGGAFGHLSHPHENLDLTFSEIKKMINDIFSGKMETYEKIDGQQISISWKNGKLVGARNKSHLKNRGETAFTVDQSPSFFNTSGNVPTNIVKSFHDAMMDLQSALSKIPSDKLENIFQEGSRFMNTEIVSQETQNVVPYFKNYLVFHGLIEYDINGNPIGNIDGVAQQLVNLLKTIGVSNQTKFEIIGPNKIVLKNFTEMSGEKRHILEELKKIQGHLSDSATIGDYKDGKWSEFIKSSASSLHYSLSSDLLSMLLGRWSRHNKGANSTIKILPKISDPQFKAWFSLFDKSESDKKDKEIIHPIELFFLHFGSEVLYHASGFLTASPDKSIAQFSEKIRKDSEEIIRSRNVDDLKKLKYEMERFEAVGGHAKLVGTEGVVFSMNGQLYKLTGVFAPLNRLLGIIKFKK